jgi:hypothetical protein
MIHTGTNLTFGAYSYDSSSKILGQWVDNGTNTSTTYTGNGSALTNLNASQLTSGTVPDAQLSTNVAKIVGGTLTIPITNSAVQIGTGSTAAKIYMDSTRIPTTPVMVLQPTNDQSAMVLDLMPRDSSGTNPANVTNNLATGTVWIHLVNKDLTVEPNNWGALGVIMSGNNGSIKMMKGGTNAQPSLNFDGSTLGFLTAGVSRSAVNTANWYFGNANQANFNLSNGNLTGPSANFSGTVTANTVTATNGFSSYATNTTAGFTGNFTNTTGLTIFVNLTNATAAAWFDWRTNNWLPASANVQQSILGPNGWITNVTGGGFWHAL